MDLDLDLDLTMDQKLKWIGSHSYTEQEYLFLEEIYKDYDLPYTDLYHRMIIVEYGDESEQAKKEGVGMFDETYKEWLKLKKWLESLDDELANNLKKWLEDNSNFNLVTSMMVSQIDKGKVSNIFYAKNNNIFNISYKPLKEFI